MRLEFVTNWLRHPILSLRSLFSDRLLDDKFLDIQEKMIYFILKFL